MTLQMNRDQGETYVKYQSSKEVIQRSKKVTTKYNKEHSSKKEKLLYLIINYIFVKVWY